MPSKDQASNVGFYRMRLRFALINLRKQWRLYYRSAYGKAGLYMLIFFIIISVAAPIITMHPPETFFAPQIDAYVATQEMASPVVSSGTYSAANIYAPVSSLLSPTGSYLVYVSTPGGRVVAVGLGASPDTPEGSVFEIANASVPSGGFAFPASVFPLSNYQSLITTSTLNYSNYMMVSSTGGGISSIRVSELEWSGGIPGYGKIRVLDNETVRLNGTLLLSPDTNSPSTAAPLPPWVPFNSPSAEINGFTSAMIFAIISNSSGTFLEAYGINPMTLMWSLPLPGNGTAAEPLYMGSYYSPGKISSATLLVERSNSIAGLNPVTGKIAWLQDNFTSPLNTTIGLKAPQDYQILNSPNNSAMFVSGNRLLGINVLNGSVYTIYTTKTDITTFATTPGSSGFPSSIIAVTHYHFYLIRGQGRLYAGGKIKIPVVSGDFLSSPLYDPNTQTFVLLSTQGSMVSVSSIVGKYPFLWHASYLPGTQDSPPSLLANANTGGYSLAFNNRNGKLVLYSMVGSDKNPLPPTLHSPSGNVYLFGTNIYGQDLWSQWVASFPVDLEVGIVVAAGTLLISVVVAMLVGYLGGFVGSSLETFSLIIFLIPTIPLVIVMASILGSKSLLNIILVFIAVGWPFTTFTLIGVVKSLRSRTFIEASKACGAGTMQILRRHMLSNMTPLLAYLTAIGIGAAVGGISGLQVLGIGPTDIPTWGAMLNPFYTNFFLVARAWWWVIPPTVTLTAFIFMFVFISRGLDEVVNPRLRRR
ncbi:MAG: ABC transporter permease [Candidatus Thermoplasmatota archaeon]|jgi:peptide/nickel transport system permease protein|nr:ABC transporter permease [Candidatus Sysuiplasma jiujiangense]MBX8640587.1 ABC transporter permease [Candidatus Sysuiplasma jiujiangense]MBX8642079.1 ABC transporter permease [Candidatus Sysuiplasma jiujiangense]MCL4316714.1 ABC transporter permease [Candidatus Thermoplasmatota archaeon]MCL5254182.1 ABC transporter permease [Candidatus Thermoplasmatota archaeon]